MAATKSKRCGEKGKKAYDNGKHPGGAPPFYDVETGPQEMEDKLNAYFESCNGTVLTDPDGHVMVDKYGTPVVLDRKPPTIAGIALALGFESTQSLFDYAKKREFSAIIARAKLTVQAYTEQRLFDKDGQRGAEFALKCYFGLREPKEAQEEQAGVGIVILPPVKDGGGGA